MTTPPIKLLLESEREDYGSPGVRVKLMPVYLDDEGKIRNPYYTGYSDDVLGHLDDFVISGRFSPAFDWYGWEADFESPYRVTLRRAEVMVKTLRKVERRLETERTRLGYPPDFPTYAARVAEAIGAKLGGTTFGLRPPRGEAMWATGDRVRWTDLDGLRYRLDDLAREITPANT